MIHGPKKYNPYGWTHPDRPIEEMCILCKNEDTLRIIDDFELQKYKDYYKGQPFKAFHCYCCGNVIHFPLSALNG